MTMVSVTGFAQGQKKVSAAETKTLMELWNREMYQEMKADEVTFKYIDLDSDGQDELIMSSASGSGLTGFMLLSKHAGQWCIDYTNMAASTGAYEMLQPGLLLYSFSFDRHINDDFVFDSYYEESYLRYEHSTLIFCLTHTQQLKEGVNPDHVDEANYTFCINESYNLNVCNQTTVLTEEQAKSLVPNVH